MRRTGWALLSLVLLLAVLFSSEATDYRALSDRCTNLAERFDTLAADCQAGYIEYLTVSRQCRQLISMLRELKEGYEDLAGESDYWEEMYGGHVDECEDLLRDCGDGVQACDALAEWVRLLEESASEKGRECKVLADQCTDEQEYDALLSAYQALEKAYEGMHHQYLTGQRLLRRHQSSLRRWQDDAEDLEEELEEWC